MTLKNDIRGVIGVVLALGLLFRTGGHIFTAAALDRNPRLEADLEPRPEGATDVRLVSPVPSLRDDAAHMVARLACAAFAFLLVWMLPVGSIDSLPGYWLVLNWLVLVADPVVGAALLAKGGLRSWCESRASGKSQLTMFPRRD